MTDSTSTIRKTETFLIDETTEFLQSNRRKYAGPEHPATNRAWFIRRPEPELDYPILWGCSTSVPYGIEIYGSTYRDIGGLRTLDEISARLPRPLVYIKVPEEERADQRFFLIDIDRLRIDDNRFIRVPDEDFTENDQASVGSFNQLDFILIRLSKKVGIYNGAPNFPVYDSMPTTQLPTNAVYAYERVRRS